MRMTPDVEEFIRCTVTGCSCVCFKAGSDQIRSCDRCGHGWVAHALEKLHFQAQRPFSCGPVEVALPGLVFDLSSLVLYGAQAIPVRLKILLDRLYSILTPEQVGHILRTLGWSLGDYVRGYMLQFPSGKVLDHWVMVTPEEELLILKQFLRFGETRPIVELMTTHCLAAVNQHSDPEPRPTLTSGQSNMFMEQNSQTPGVLENTRGNSCFTDDVCCLKENGPVDQGDPVPSSGNFLGGHSLLLPRHYLSSSLQRLGPSTKDLGPAGRLTSRSQKHKLAERPRQEGRRAEQENDPILQQRKGEPTLRVKADPDKPNLAWPPDPRFVKDQDLHRGLANQEKTSVLSSSLNSSFIPTPSSLYVSFSSSPMKSSQELQSSSSFLRPLSAASFPSSLHPLPSSLCSLSSFSPAGRKGRVCCGVCGKSFYDKGTLKIHYNAVHLKIKHRCTVAGCAMVFSSLRSRNRHSANPNPRLHTGTHTQRNVQADPHATVHSDTQKDKATHQNDTRTHTCGGREVSNSLWQQEDGAHTLTNGHVIPQHGCQDITPPRTSSPPPSPPSLPKTLSQDANQSFTLSDSTHRSDLHPQDPPPPPPPLLPVCSTSPMGSPPSIALPSLHTNPSAPAPLPGPIPNLESHDCGVTEEKRGQAHVSPPTNQQGWREFGGPVVKRKSRKSSTPVKIEREKVEDEGNEEEEEC